MLRIVQVIKSSLTLSLIGSSFCVAVHAQQVAPSRFSQKTPPVPEEVFTELTPKTQQAIGLWGSRGELKRLPAVDSQVPLPVKKVVATQSTTSKIPPVPSSRFESPKQTQVAEKPQRLIPAEPINWNRPTVIAGGSPSVFSNPIKTAPATETVASKPQNTHQTSKPIEAQITPGRSLHAAQRPGYSRFATPANTQVATAKDPSPKPVTVANSAVPAYAKYQSRFSSPAVPVKTEPKLPEVKKNEVAPVSHAEATKEEPARNNAVFARITDDEENKVESQDVETNPTAVKEASKKELSPIFVCRLLGLKQTGTADNTTVK